MRFRNVKRNKGFYMRTYFKKFKSVKCLAFNFEVLVLGLWSELRQTIS